MDILSALPALFATTILPFLVLIAAVFFLWGIITVITAQENDQYDEGRALIIYGFFGVSIFAVLWGVLHFIGANTSSIL